MLETIFILCIISTPLLCKILQNDNSDNKLIFTSLLMILTGIGIGLLGLTAFGSFSFISFISLLFILYGFCSGIKYLRRK